MGDRIFKDDKAELENGFQKRAFFKFFEIFIRKFVKLVKMNLLYILFALPTFILAAALSYFLIFGVCDLFLTNELLLDDKAIVYISLFGSVVFANFYIAAIGAGPASVGYHRVLSLFANETHSWLWEDFKNCAKENLRQGIAVFSVDFVILLIFGTTAVIYTFSGNNFGILKYFIYAILLLYLLVHTYLYPLMSRFKMSVLELYKNSLLFSVGKFPSSFFVLILQGFIHIVIPVFIARYFGRLTPIALSLWFVFELLFMQSFSAFIVSYNSNKKIDKFISEK